MIPFSESYLGQLRQAVGNRMLLMPSGRALILRDGTHALMQYRADLRRWGLPAGYPEQDETMEELIRREALEETGLTLLDPTPYAFSSDPARETVTYPNGDQVQSFTLDFVATRFEGEVRADAESIALEWRPIENPPDGMLPGHQGAVEAYLRFRESGEFQLT